MTLAEAMICSDVRPFGVLLCLVLGRDITGAASLASSLAALHLPSFCSFLTFMNRDG